MMDLIPPRSTTFFSLPPEIRTQVYRLCLLPKREDTQTHRQAVTVKPYRKARASLNLLLGCKEIYVEAVQYAYESRWWQLGDVPSHSSLQHLLGGTSVFNGPALMAPISSQTMTKIQNLHLKIPIFLHGAFEAAPVVLRNLENIESLIQVTACLYFQGCAGCYATLADSPLLIGLMIQILTQVPKHVMLSWEVRMFNPSASAKKYPYTRSDEAVQAVRYLAAQYLSLQGSRCGPLKLVNSLEKCHSTAAATC